jgi:hypothetical protein
MEAWMSANALRPVLRPARPAEPASRPQNPIPEGLGTRRGRTTESIKKQLDEAVEGLGSRDLDKILTFAEFVRARRTAKTIARAEAATVAGAAPPPPPEDSAVDFEPPSSQQRAATRGG